MQVPESPRVSLQKAHRTRVVIVLRCRGNEPIELTVKSHEHDIVVRFGGTIHVCGNSAELLALPLGSALRGKAAHQTLEFASDLQNQKLFTRIRLGNENTFARQNGDKVLAAQSLQGFADRCAPDLEIVGQCIFGNEFARLELQRDNALFQFLISPFGQRFASCPTTNPSDAFCRRAGLGDRGLPHEPTNSNARAVKSVDVWRTFARISRFFFDSRISPIVRFQRFFSAAGGVSFDDFGDL